MVQGGYILKYQQISRKHYPAPEASKVQHHPRRVLGSFLVLKLLSTLEPTYPQIGGKGGELSFSSNH